MIAPMAQMFLFGTEIDYETSLLSSGFRFRNPNVAEACGCGESIKFKSAEDLAAERAAGRAASGA
jgi:iron-sulfur cluster assembly protein